MLAQRPRHSGIGGATCPRGVKPDRSCGLQPRKRLWFTSTPVQGGVDFLFPTACYFRQAIGSTSGYGP